MKVREGSIVIVKGGFGLESSKKVVVEGIDEKNGRPLIDYEDRWAYFSQIEKVVKY